MNDDLQAVLQSAYLDIGKFNHNVIGDPNGIESYAYVRVSSSGQAEEGRSGLPRQLLHIHEKATEQGLMIPWNLVYFDDHSGFDLRDRPGLNLLLEESENIDRSAHSLVIEYLDRLSRQARWHQGFLLDTFAEQQLEVHFWKSFGSEIERAVFGVISEQGMRLEIERMTQGTRMKAESGRITAKTPAYGFMFADSEDRPSTDPSSNYRKDTHYLPHPDEAPVVQEIYTRIASGESLFQVCDDLNRRQIPTPKRSRFWETSTVSKMIKSTLYKGEYVANRLYNTKEWSDRAQRVVRKQHTRPPEEWIIVSVPALISPELWQANQEAPKRNLKRSVRNGSVRYLLQGMMKCANCGASMNIVTSNRAGGQDRFHSYICRARLRQPVIREAMPCDAPWVRGPEIDDRVWNSICSIIADPAIVIAYVEKMVNGSAMESHQDRLSSIERQIAAYERENARWDEAYAAEVFSLEEYKDKKLSVAEKRDSLKNEIAKLQEGQSQVDDLERQKRLIRQQLETLQEAGIGPDIPFEDKRRIVGLLVDKIVIDPSARWYQLEGAITGAREFTVATQGKPLSFTCMSSL